jgi:ABC-type antimicrobial peptide transport system permease subunit
MTWPLRVSPSDLAQQAIAALLAHRLRAALSAIGIIVGIATVVTAFAIGEGARRAALSEIGALGIDNVFVQATVPPPSINRRQRPPAPVLSLDDVRVIHATVGGVVAVAASRSARVEMRSDAGHRTGWLTGVTASWSRVVDVDVAAGRWPTAEDDRSRRRVAVIGDTLARQLFAAADPIGARVLAGGTWYVVVGRLRNRSASGAGSTIQSGDAEQSLIVPIATMDVSLGEGDAPDRVQQIGARLRGPADAERAAQTVSALMARRHADAPRYEIVVPRELLRARLRTQRAFDVVLVGIGVLALVISGVGIMNIMLASVAERAQEVGVRRAFGARRVEIVAQFAIEAAALCVAGGLVGVPIGALLSGIVAVAAGWPVSVTPWAVCLALTLACGVGLTFGIYPACVAANIQPVEALRS